MMRFRTGVPRGAAIAGVAFLLSLTAVASTSTWQFDPERSWAEFSVRYLAISSVRGSFTKVHGTAKLDDQDAAKSTVDVTIDVSNLDTHEADRDRELRSDKFFDAAHYPAMTFKSKKVEQVISTGKLTVTGDLTIRGVTREVVLDIIGPSAPSKEGNGKERSAVTATTKINRQDFGIKGNTTMDNGKAVAGDEVSITLHIEMVKQAPAK